MKFLAALFAFAVVASAQEISREDIVRTVEHMRAIVAAQAGELAIEKQAHIDAETHVAEKQVEVNSVTAFANTQAKRADTAEDALDAANAKLAIQAKELRKLKTCVCGAGALLAAALLVMMGLPSRAMPWGIVATVAIPAMVFAGLWAAI